MTRNELYYKIEHGDDIEVSVGERKFTIMTSGSDGRYYITEQFPFDDNDGEFDTIDELLDGFMIDSDNSIGSLVEEIKIDNYTSVW